MRILFNLTSKLIKKTKLTLIYRQGNKAKKLKKGFLLVLAYILKQINHRTFVFNFVKGKTTTKENSTYFEYF